MYCLSIVLGQLTFGPQNATVIQGQVTGFECYAPHSSPPVEITWFKGSVPLDISGHRHVSASTGTLLIRDAVSSDEGEYYCQVRNMAGVRSSGSAFLTVLDTNSTNEGERVLWCVTWCY